MSRMNMPINKKGRVTFTTTLFALIRDNLKINVSNHLFPPHS